MTSENNSKKENKKKKAAQEMKTLKPLNNLGDVFKNVPGMKALMEQAEKYRAKKAAQKANKTQETMNRGKADK